MSFTYTELEIDNQSIFKKLIAALCMEAIQY